MVISGNLTTPGVVLTKSLGDAGNSLPVWDSNGASASVDYTGVRSGRIPYSIRYNCTSTSNSFTVIIDVGTSVLTQNSLVLWSIVHQDGHLEPYTWSRSYDMNYGTGIITLVFGAGGTGDLSANTAVSGSINYQIL